MDFVNEAPGLAHKHSGLDKYKFRLPNIRYATTKYIYRIFSMGLMDSVHKHSDFEKCKFGLPNIRHTR